MIKVNKGKVEMKGSMLDFLAEFQCLLDTLKDKADWHEGLVVELVKDIYKNDGKGSKKLREEFEKYIEAQKAKHEELNSVVDSLKKIVEKIFG